MIIWLASYPRSGNTLLRTILKATMGLGSYVDEEGEHISRMFSQKDLDVIGDQAKKEPWMSFYEKATVSDQRILVKTHFPPMDNQPGIYIVRDGRLSVVSYFEYHQAYFAEAKKGLIQLICGDDYYGDWSTHFHSWNSRKDGKVLLLRFEQLVNCPKDLLAEIAAFIDHGREIRDWENPFASLNRDNPLFFRRGEGLWKPPEYWTQANEYLFYLIHGPLMTQLGYCEEAEIRAVIDHNIMSDFKEVLQALRNAIREKQGFQKMCDEKEKIIEELKIECSKRLEVISVLQDEAEIKRIAKGDRRSKKGDTRRKA